MDDEPVETGGHRGVSGRLEDGRGVHPGSVAEAICRERLCRRDVLPVDMGDRSGFPDVCFEAAGEYLSLFVHHPESRHRNLRVALAVHSVRKVRPVVLVALRVASHTVLRQDLVLYVVVVFGNHVADGAPPVEEESLRFSRVVQDHARECRQPAEQAVSFPLEEFLLHVLGPGLRTGLVAVRKEILDAPSSKPAAAGVTVGVQICFQIVGYRHRVYLVDFQASGFR